MPAPPVPFFINGATAEGAPAQHPPQLKPAPLLCGLPLHLHPSYLARSFLLSLFPHSLHVSRPRPESSESLASPLPPASTVARLRPSIVGAPASFALPRDVFLGTRRPCRGPSRPPVTGGDDSRLKPASSRLCPSTGRDAAVHFEPRETAAPPPLDEAPPTAPSSSRSVGYLAGGGPSRRSHQLRIPDTAD